MGAGFVTAMRGAVLNGGKPMLDFVHILQQQDKRRGAARPLTEGGFRADWIRAKIIVSQDAKQKAREVSAGLDGTQTAKLLPVLGQPLTWRSAGEHICTLAKEHLRATANLSPEDALRVTVKKIIADGQPKRSLNPLEL